MKFYSLYHSHNIRKEKKYTILKWSGYVVRIMDNKNAYKIVINQWERGSLGLFKYR
jgi:hypothetical protein